MRAISAWRSACSRISRDAMRGASGQASRRRSASLSIRCAMAWVADHSRRRRKPSATWVSAWRRAGLARMRRAREPGRRVEQLHGREQHVAVGVAQRVRGEVERAAEARALLAQALEQFGVARGGLAQALQRVRAPAELLQDRVVGDGAELARVADAG